MVVSRRGRAGDPSRDVALASARPASRALRPVRPLAAQRPLRTHRLPRGGTRRARRRGILLAPVTLLWRRRPKKLRGGVRDFLFGDPEEPGAIRSVSSFLFHRRQAVLKVSAPIDLSTVAAEDPVAAKESVARRVRG